MKTKCLLLLVFMALTLQGCGRPQQRWSPPVAVPYQAPKAQLPPQPRPSPEPVADADIVIPPFIPKGEKRPLIVIDPGHGGEDFGTNSRVPPKYQEKYLNLATSRMLNGYLKQLGFDTVMTRDSDVFVSLDKRALFANTQKPKVFVSVHYNSAPSKEAEGIEVFYYRSEDNKSRSDESKQLAQAVLGQLLKTTGAKSRGVKHGNLSVIRQTKMPAILVEGGFLTNEKEMEKIKDASYLKKVAWGIAQGIKEYIGE